MGGACRHGWIILLMLIWCSGGGDRLARLSGILGEVEHMTGEIGHASGTIVRSAANVTQALALVATSGLSGVSTLAPAHAFSSNGSSIVPAWMGSRTAWRWTRSWESRVN